MWEFGFFHGWYFLERLCDQNARPASRRAQAVEPAQELHFRLLRPFGSVLAFILNRYTLAIPPPVKEEILRRADPNLPPHMPKKVPPSSDFGKRLVDARRARGLTQTELAELIGSSQRAISSYETVAEFPPATTIVKLAQVLKVSTDELFGIEKPKAPPMVTQDPETKRLWKKFLQVMVLPEKDRRAVIRLINSLVSVTNQE